MQFITITGRVGKDAETRQAGGNDVTSFNVAVDQGYGERKSTNWFRVSVWGKKGSGAAPYILKGGIVTVVGDLELSEYEGKQQLNINAANFTLPAKQSGGGQQRQEPQQQSRQAQPIDDDFDSVPF